MRKVIILIVSLLIPTSGICQGPGEKFKDLVGNWSVVKSSFTNPNEQFRGTFLAVPIANSHALYTIYKQGTGESYYEANTIWSYSELSKEVRIYEVNSLGFADMHVGHFEATNVLLVELKNAETGELLQRRLMTWGNDTLTMKASFFANGAETKHYLEMVRDKR